MAYGTTSASLIRNGTHGIGEQLSEQTPVDKALVLRGRAVHRRVDDFGIRLSLEFGHIRGSALRFLPKGKHQPP